MSNQSGVTSGNMNLHESEAFFGLSEEVSKQVNLQADGNEEEIGNYLQKLHIKNHTISSREIVHDLYTPVEDLTDMENQLLSDFDEFLFEEVREAMSEKEIHDLRANLQSIASNTVIHEHSTEEIEAYITGELDDEIAAMMQDELSVNNALAAEIALHREVNSAIEEQDIMALRGHLKQMMQSEFSHSRTVAEIDSYLNDDLEESDKLSLEEEMFLNAGLAADIAFHQEVDSAIGEDDIMSLRANLQSIAKEESERKHELLGVASSGKRKIVWYAAASSIVLMLGFGAMIQHHSSTTQQLYASYYQPYSNGAIVSRSAVSSVNEVNKAIRSIDAGDFSTALELLGSIPVGVTEPFVTDFYSGVAYQGKGEYQHAIKSYIKVVKDGDNLLVEQAEWYIGLCYLRTEERMKAVEQFRSIVQRNGYYRDPSLKILKQLE